MTLPARFPVCPLCHGVHKAIPACVGRPQTEAEWMIDRGVTPERAYAIRDARDRAGLPSLVLEPDPAVHHIPPFGAPPRAPAPPPEPVQEVLF